MNILKIGIMALAVTACAGAKEETAAPIGKNEITLESDRMTPEALWAMGRIGSTAVSSDGRQIAYTVSYYSVEQNRSRTRIYVMDAGGSNPKQVSHNPDENVSESEPTFIRNNTELAFLSGGQLWSIRLSDGKARQLTDGDDVEGYLFSPDKKHVILIHQVPATTSIAPQEADLPKATGLVINDMNYKHWDQYVQTIPHPFLYDFDGDRVSAEGTDLLADEPFECPVLPFGGTEQLCWSPDSKHVAYTSRKKTGVDYAISTDTDIYLYNIEDGSTRNLCKPEGYVEPTIDATISMQHQAKNQSPVDINAGYDQDPQFSPDGKYIAWKSMERDGYESDRLRLCVLNLESGEKTYTTEAFESGVDEFAWADDSQTLYFLGVWHARTHVYSTNLQGEVKALTSGDYDYAGLSVMPGGEQLLIKRHSISAPDDIYSLTLQPEGEAKVTRLTAENDHILSQLALGEVKERWVKTTDNKQMLCWVVYPPHFDPAKKYPTLLFCEGGPQSPVSQFWSYRWNFQIMADNDYIVIAPNRRGLPGFGMEWLEEISGDYSGQCMKDYLSAIDDICREPYVDKDHLGCIGASFGGYSVYWLAGNHDKRFKAFIAHDGIFNTHQQYFETEEMWFPNWDLGGTPSRKAGEKVFLESPHLYVDRWDTPILCIHGEKDYRILHSQGQSAFSAARMRGIPAQLLLYPDENHWVLKPQNGILWQRTFFRWLDRWLKD